MHNMNTFSNKINLVPLMENIVKNGSIDEIIYNINFIKRRDLKINEIDLDNLGLDLEKVGRMTVSSFFISYLLHLVVRMDNIENVTKIEDTDKYVRLIDFITDSPECDPYLKINGKLAIMACLDKENRNNIYSVGCILGMYEINIFKLVDNGFRLEYSMAVQYNIEEVYNLVVRYEQSKNFKFCSLLYTI